MRVCVCVCDVVSR